MAYPASLDTITAFSLMSLKCYDDVHFVLGNGHMWFFQWYTHHSRFSSENFLTISGFFYFTQYACREIVLTTCGNWISLDIISGYLV